MKKAIVLVVGVVVAVVLFVVKYIYIDDLV